MFFEKESNIYIAEMKKSSSEKSCIKGLTNGQNGIIINKSSEVHSVDLLSFSGDNGEKVPPVPIPNTEVKLLSAESTWLATAREDRSSPVSKAACIFMQVVFLYPETGWKTSAAREHCGCAACPRHILFREETVRLSGVG